MAFTPHLKDLSHHWLELHPVLVSKLKGYGISVGIGTLLAIAAWLVTKLEVELQTFQMVVAAAEMKAGESYGPLDAGKLLGQHPGPLTWIVV